MNSKSYYKLEVESPPVNEYEIKAFIDPSSYVLRRVIARNQSRAVEIFLESLHEFEGACEYALFIRFLGKIFERN